MKNSMQNKKINLPVAYLFLFCFVMLILQSCNPTVYLTENEALLTENKIVLKDRKTLESRGLLKSELELNYLQKPNREFIFIPREWYFFKFESSPDSSFLVNWIRKNVAESPSIHNDEFMQRTAESMENYLRLKKGYYNATVEPKVKIKNQEAFVSYIVKTDIQYKVNELEFSSEDQNLNQYMDQIKLKTLIPNGTPITELKFTEEKNRIVRSLQDEGYARFNSNYVKFRGDTSGYKMDVFVDILAPGPGIKHQKFSIGDIKVYTDHNIAGDSIISNHVEIEKIDFYSNGEDFFVTPGTISKRIFIEEGAPYVRTKEIRTSQNLSILNAYRFVSLNPVIDDEIDTIINYNFLLTPIQNKWVVERGASAYLANVQSDSTSNFLGLNLSYDLASRNLLQKAESFNIGLNGNIEFNLKSIFSGGLTLENRLSLPRLSDITRVLYLSNKIGLVPLKTYNSLYDNTSTELSVSYSFNYTATIYSLTSLNGSYGFNYSPNINSSTIFNQMGINYLRLDPLEGFVETLQRNPYLANSFNKRLLTGFIFKDIGYIFNTNPNSSGFNWGLTYFVETSGIEISALNSTYNLFAKSNKIWELPLQNDAIEFSKFIKFDLDHHFNQKIYGQHNFAGKFRAGIALPFGGSEAVPYVRQFAAGGQNSIRGWQIRELGPGGYNISKDPSAFTATLPYQTGDILFESSLEYRFPVYGFLKGALFVDAGNVWVLSGDDERIDSKFSKDFIKQIAVASGFGIRMDFSYFLLRFDFGYKIRNPFPDETGSYLNYHSFQLSNIRDTNLSFGINLPF